MHAMAVMQVEMILQAFEYEQAYQINCQEFFDSTQGKLTTPTAQAWADEIIARRKHTQVTAEDSR